MNPQTVQIIPPFLAALAFAAIFAGYLNKMFWPSQIKESRGVYGIPLVVHAATYVDPIVLPLLFFWILPDVSNDWNTGDLMWAGFIGLALTSINHRSLVRYQDKPDPFSWKGEKWPLSSILHFPYMAGAIACIALILLFSPSATPNQILITALVAGIHSYLGMHMWLGIIQRIVRIPWLPFELISISALVTCTVLWVALIGASWWATRSNEVGLLLSFVAAVLLLPTFVIKMLRPHSK